MTHPPLPVSATMLVKNAERYLPQVLVALSAFDEVLLLDNGSHDKTLAIAEGFANVRIRHHEFDGFGPMKNRAAEWARNDWIFNIDSDEVADAELLAALAAVDWTHKDCVYTVSRLNHYRGRPIKSCGWYPDIIPRLYHRGHTRFSDAAVHERIQIPQGSAVKKLSGSLLHYSYDSAEELLAKAQYYSTLYAKAQAGKKTATAAQAFGHGLAAFVKNYFFKRGFSEGGDGLVIAVSQAVGSFYKYAKLREHAGRVSGSLKDGTG